MGSNLVIAAIPDENDPVWKVSSEKIPHLTLLFLGEADAVSNLDQIMLFVEHAARTSMKRFYLPVDRRGELGDDKADVLFFKKNRYDFKAVRDFRSTLLQDQNIKTAYDSAEQFDGPWNPHLTLGYPETPAKPVGDGQISSFYSVDFNKIAVWTGDFEGPDWLLKDYWDEMDEMMDSVPMDVAMSDIEHHGVKGQKWGVRKVEGGGDKAHIRINQKTGQAALSTQSTVAIVVPALTFAPLTPLAFLSPRVRAEVKAARTVNKGIHEQKKIAKADKKFEKNAQSAKNFVEIHNGAQDQINKHIADVNKKYPQDLTKDPKAQKQYDDEITKGLQAAYRTSANQLGNKTGTRHLDLEFHNDGLDFKIVAKEGMQTPTPERVVHAAVDDSSVEFTGKIKRDATGHIVGFEFDDFEPQSMAQTVDMGMEFLEHHGVKGMKWGVRKSDVGNAAKSGVKTVGRGVKKTGKGLVTLGKNVAFESEGQKQRKTKQVHRAATEKFTKHDLPRINAKYKDTQAATLKGRLKNPLNSDTRAYRSESRIAYRDRVNEAVNALPTNSSGKRKYEIEDSGKTNAQYGWTLKVVDVKKTVQHAEDVGLLDEFAVQPVFDADGFITDVRMVESTLAQSTDFDSELDRKVDLGAEFLEHHGVKGMKWGVRRAAAAIGRGVKKVGRGLAALGAALADSHWQSSTSSDIKQAAVHNHVAKELDNHIERLQRSPKYRGKNLRTDADLRKEYYQDVAKVTDSSYKRAVKNTFGENPSGTRTAHYVVDARGPRIEIRDKNTGFPSAESPLSSMRDIKARDAAFEARLKTAAQHAATTDAPDISIDLKIDENGQISGVGFVRPVDDAAAEHTAELGAEFLEHYGIKGMHWGVRRAGAVTTRAHIDSGIVRRQTRIQARGGEAHPPTHDAINAAISKQKLKKSGTAALSNKELKDLQTRLQLEIQVQQLTTSKGKKVVARQLEEEGKQQLSKGIRKGAPLAIKKASKGAATAAVTTALL